MDFAFISIALQKSFYADRRQLAAQCYHPAMRRLPLPLLVLIILIAFPVAVPIAIVSWIWDQRRMRTVAERTHCESCGTTLGSASLHRAETEWAKRVSALMDGRPAIRLRTVRSLWAICAACGAEYDYDFRTRMFCRAIQGGESDDPGKASAQRVAD